MGEKPRGFVCLYYGGTGSSWLLNTLETSPEVLIPAYEPLEWMHWKAADEAKLAWVDAVLDPPDPGDETAMAAWLERLTASPQFVPFDPKPFRVVGFKMSPEAVHEPAALLDLVAKRDARLLGIVRHNRVKHALSLYRTHEEDKHQFHGEGLLPATRLRRRAFLKWLDYSERVHADMQRLMGAAVARVGSDGVMEVPYEEFVTAEGKARTVARVGAFLGMDPSTTTWSRYQKATPDDLHSAVENYAAMERWVRRAGHTADL